MFIFFCHHLNDVGVDENHPMAVAQVHAKTFHIYFFRFFCVFVSLKLDEYFCAKSFFWFFLASLPDDDYDDDAHGTGT